MNVEPQPTTNNLNLNNITDSISSGVTNTIQSLKQTVANTQNSLQQSINEFSSKSAADAGNEFLESNTLIAKFAFIILVLFGFMFLFRIGMMIIALILSPTESPYLVQGMIRGNNPVTISQNSRTSSALVNYSENKPTGLEFTYSVWLSISAPSDTESHIFNKGLMVPGSAAGSTVPQANAPGMYVKSVKDAAAKADGTTNTLIVYMDTFQSSGMEVTSLDSQRQKIEVTGIPFNKWVNMTIRVENRIMDIYVNGILAQHKDLGFVPKQNFGDVFVCQNGGFNGSLSDLRYYAKALNVFEINNIVAWGPNLNTSASSQEAKTTSDSYYLSSLWYKATR
jgi:hypothetical protein